MRRLPRLTAILVLSALALPAAAQSNTAFVYQGVLKDAGGPASGSYNIDVSLWDAQAGGSQEGPAIMFNAVPVVDGRFTLELDFSDRMLLPYDLWIELSINGTELSPRQKISGAPVSIRTRGIHVGLDGSVGIGTAAPAGQLDVMGRAYSGGVDSGFTVRNPNNANANVTLDWFNDVARIRIGGSGAGSQNGLDIQSAGNQSLLRILQDGRVGIGADSPLAPLHVNGQSRFDGDMLVNNARLDVTGGSLLINSDTTYWPAQSITSAAGATGFWAVGFYGQSLHPTSPSAGLYGHSASNIGSGAFGLASAASGETYGVRGWSDSNSGRGVYGYADSTTGATYGVYGEARSTNGRGVYGVNSASSGGTIGVLAQVNSASGWAGYFLGPAGSANYFQRNVGIGTTSPSFQLQLSSNSAAKPTSDRWTISSDERLKKNIQPINAALDSLMRLRGVTYQWKDPASQGDMTGTYTGMIAQDVEKVFPEWVGEDAKGFKTLTIAGFEGVIIEALRELRAQSDSKIHQLEDENQRLRERLDAIESMLAAQSSAVASDH